MSSDRSLRPRNIFYHHYLIHPEKPEILAWHQPSCHALVPCASVSVVDCSIVEYFGYFQNHAGIKISQYCMSRFTRKAKIWVNLVIELRVRQIPDRAWRGNFMIIHFRRLLYSSLQTGGFQTLWGISCHGELTNPNKIFDKITKFQCVFTAGNSFNTFQGFPKAMGIMLGC